MNITEISIGDRILVSNSPSEKEVMSVKGIRDDGLAIVRNSFGNILAIAPDKIIKRFK